MRDLAQDFRLAITQLRRNPLFVVGAAASLAIGMALSVALFSVVAAALLRPLPYPEPDRLVGLVESTAQFDMSRVPPHLVTELRSSARSFAATAVFTTANPHVVLDGTSRRLSASRVTDNFFRTLRVNAARGRVFNENDATPGTRTAILAQSVWETQFGSDPATLGRVIRIDREPYTIVGVMPATFDYPRGTKIWLPLNEQTLTADAGSPRDLGWSPYYAISRLAPGALLESANAELAVAYRRLYSDDADHRYRSAGAIPLSELVTAEVRSQLRLWGAAAILILLLCAVNFATMTLARGMRRRDDIALRSALGASRFRIVRMLVVESVIFALLGGAAAVLLAAWLLSFVRVLFADGALPVDPSIDWVSVAFGTLATVVVGIVFALAPALELAKVDLRTIMQGGAATTTTRGGELRGRRALVALQLCLALTAVSVVAALIRADRRFQTADIGYNYAPLLVADVLASDTSVRTLSIQPFLDEATLMPGVTAIAASGSVDDATMWADRPDGEASRALITRVSPDFFRTLGVTPLAGRVPLESEIAASAPVVVLSRSPALARFGSEAAAVGRRVRVKLRRRPAQTLTVVGVVADLGGNGLNQFSSTMYSVQPLTSERAGVLVVRVRGEPQKHVKSLMSVFASLQRGINVENLAPARVTVDATLRASRGRTLFLTAVAALAFMLAIVGVYGLTAYTTELRGRELGIRIALGASPWHLVRVVTGELWWMAALGVGTGILATSRLVILLDTLFRNPMMKRALITFPVGPTIASAVALAAIMLLGTSIPLHRVLRIDVMRIVQGNGG